MTEKLMRLPLIPLAWLACWLLSLTAWSWESIGPFPLMPLVLPGLVCLFLRLGPLAGAGGVMVWGSAMEGVSALPVGRMIIVAAMVGLLLLHLSRLQSWSPIGRGGLMCLLGGGLWWGAVLFLETPASAWSHSTGSQLQAAGLFGAWAISYWLLAAVLLNGMRVVWRETATRPVRFGSEYD